MDINYLVVVLKFKTKQLSLNCHIVSSSINKIHVKKLLRVSGVDKKNINIL